MKVAIGIQVSVLLVLLTYWVALCCGLQIPPANQSEVTAGKDVLLVLLNLASLSSMIQAVNNKISKEGEQSGKTSGSTDLTAGA